MRKMECETCGAPLPGQPARGQPRRFCSDACRQDAYRKRAQSAQEPENGPEAGTPGQEGHFTPLGAQESRSKAEYRNARHLIPVRDPVTILGVKSWLWVDPKRESGHDPKSFDAAAFLGRAVVLFRAKARWDGQPPEVVRAHPGDGLGEAAAVLGLRVVEDPRVAPGTCCLGAGGR